MNPEEKKPTIFINGLISNDVADTAPEWILGKGAINVPQLAEWLELNKALANEKGYINYTVKRSKNTGKRFVEVDTYKAVPKEDVQIQPDFSDILEGQPF